MIESPIFPDPIPGIIPFGTLTIFAGAAGAGKTTMIADWVGRWRTGRTIWGKPTNPPTDFAIISMDRQWETNRQIFAKAGYPNIPHYALAEDDTFDHAELMKPYDALNLFHRLLDMCYNGTPPPPGAHVIVDPAVPLLIAGNPNAARDVARSLLGYTREARQRQITLTALAHFGKQGGDVNTRYTRPQDRIAGSGAFAGYSDTQMYLCDAEPPERPYQQFGWVPRLTPPEEFHCVRDPNTGLFIPYDVITEDLTAGQVLDCLDHTGSTTVQIIRQRAQEKGHSRATVTRALSKLLDDRLIARVGRGVYQRATLN